MTFYSEETTIGLALASVPALISVYLFVVRGKIALSLWFLLLSALLLRLVMISLDPYLYFWDERYHALVAKNMMDHPFKPMLRLDPVLAYKLENWIGNHVWLHKQPLFLWQMALSMKLFGVNEFALRLPAAVMGTISVYMVFQIARFWFKNENVAYLAALLCAFSNYQLGMAVGQIMLDQNDSAFIFYVTASFWAWIRYLEKSRSVRWVVLTGIFVGCAVLIKWLTGLLVFGSWALYILTDQNRLKDLRNTIHLAWSAAIAAIVFIPWQLYIITAFPEEAKIEFEHNSEHFISHMGHPGEFSYHLELLPEFYGENLLPFLFIGLILVFLDKKIMRNLSIGLVAGVIVIYSFFSFLVLTKMPSFTYPVYGLVISLLSYGLISVFHKISEWTGILRIKWIYKLILFCILILVGFYSLRLEDIADYRSAENNIRNDMINNAIFFRSLNRLESDKSVVFNFSLYDDISMMFYNDVSAYAWYPREEEIEELMEKGYTLYFLESHGEYRLPDYILENKNLEIIEFPEP